jgi:hypothetical protein
MRPAVRLCEDREVSGRKPYREARVERWSRRIVSRDLGLPVDRFEDGTQNGMVDALIRAPFGAIPLEVVQDVNVDELRMAKALEQRGRFLDVPGLTPGWYLVLHHRANVRTLRTELPQLLLRLDELMLDRVPWATDSYPLWEDDLPRPLRRLGVQSMAPLYERTGIVAMDGEGWGGDFEVKDRLNDWVLETLEREADVPAKLRAFGTGRGDAFIWATMASDIAVTGLLTDPDVATTQRTLPARAPDLPSGVDRVWVACTLESRRAVVTDGRSWRWLDWVATAELEREDG